MALKGMNGSGSSYGTVPTTPQSQLLSRRPTFQQPNNDEDSDEENVSKLNDPSDWFKPSTTTALFVPASQLSDIAPGAMSKGKRSWDMPSEVALEKASKRLQEWEKEEDKEEQPKPKQRQVLGAVENISQSSSVPQVATQKEGPATFRPPFKTPFAATQGSPAPPARPQISSYNRTLVAGAYRNSPLNPGSQTAYQPSAKPIPAPNFGPASQRIGLGTASRGTPVPAFKSPFKPGFCPPDPASAEARRKKEREEAAAERERRAAEQRERELRGAVFDLTSRSRQTMRNAGVAPCAYSIDELNQLGMPPEISAINLENAQYYHFNAPTFSQVLAGASLQRLDVEAAFRDLKSRGCKLVEKPWVCNHWKMILWKLASLVRSCPDLLEEKWTYQEAINQLLYRYEREINRCQRPPIRLITEGDTASSRPMVLCVCGVIPGQDSTNERGEIVEALPWLDVTDGWYKVRATIDTALGRATKRGVLKVGSKIAVSGAKFQCDKEGAEPLPAYDISHLELHGNSTSLAPWDAKLGFKRSPYIATLRSLTPDGGSVMLMDILVIKLYPVGYIETNEKGERSAPRCEKEEREEMEAWKARRANEEIRLRGELEKKLNRMEGLADTLQRRSDGFHPSPDDDVPNHIDDMYEDVEEAIDPLPLVQNLTPRDSGCLANVIRSKCAAIRERAAEHLSAELESTCSPRNVRNFRVIRFRDYRKQKPLAPRVGQMTVWDVLSLGEGLQEGKRFLVTNIAPCQPNSWARPDEEGEAFFNTRRDTRWTSLELDRDSPLSW
ncbi:hypothetical protein FRB99_005684 [Tulasnella sp. 403]|nr:hypothetical protein FRB99_005684 [Tulasnella sp. 403]